MTQRRNTDMENNFIFKNHMAQRAASQSGVHAEDDKMAQQPVPFNNS